MIITTDSQTELLTLVDNKNQVLGSISRGEAHKTSGVFYRTVYILIKNEKGKILLQKRSPTKDLYPDCWDLSVGGHVNFGQSYLEAAVREVAEELNLVVNPEELIFKGETLVKLPQSGEFFNVFEYNLKPGETIKASKKEINDVRWMAMTEVKDSIENKSLKWYVRPEQVIMALY